MNFIRSFLLKNVLILFLLSFLFNSNYSLCDDEDQTVLTNADINGLISESTLDTSSKNSSLSINARSCIVIDRLTKSILYSKNEKNKVKMASTTKIMTATIIIENYNLSQEIEISKKASNTGGSRLGLKKGDKITISDLLYGLMLRSGNDAAVALAEYASGSIENFSDLMNKKAQELGLSSTHFESPHGLDSDNHYTTAYDLAILTDYALKNETFLKIVSTKNYTIKINGYNKNLINTNELLGNLEGVYGVKTGFTNGANRCLVTACKRNNMDIICVVLGCDTKKFRTNDSIKLIEYAFSNYEYVDIHNLIDNKINTWIQENSNYFNIAKSEKQDIKIKYSDLDYNLLPIKKSDINSLDITINLTKNFTAPVYENSKIGEISINCGEETIFETNLLSSTFIARKSFSNYFYHFFIDYSYVLNNLYNVLL